MIILIAGMPRSGSMWTYNVTRECVRATGETALPVEPPVIEEDALREALQHAHDESRIYCIKTHEHVPHNFPIDKIICNYRDVRDAMISYMKFTHCDFEFGLHIAGRMMSLTDHFFRVQPARLLKLHFDDVKKPDTAGLVREISEFLGTGLSDRNIRDISSKFSRSNVRDLVNALNQVNFDESGQIKRPEQTENYISTRNWDGTFRAYDRKSGFQGNHFTGTKNAEWKTFLTQEQQERLLELATDWLTRYGFKI